jgi:hypothetical protein
MYSAAEYVVAFPVQISKDFNEGLRPPFENNLVLFACARQKSLKVDDFVESPAKNPCFSSTIPCDPLSVI